MIERMTPDQFDTFRNEVLEPPWELPVGYAISTSKEHDKGQNDFCIWEDSVYDRLGN